MAHCIVCGKRAYSDYCVQHKPRKPLKTYKPIPKIGKQTKKTNAAVAKWKRTQKPNHQGYFECYICHKWVTYLEAEHKQSKVRHPELRTDQTNFAATCSDCNREKESNDN